MAPPVEGRPFDCSFCAKSFIRHEHQKRHEVTVHAAAKPYRCSACVKEFVRKDALQRHEATHQASSPNLLQIGARACWSCASARVKCSGEAQCRRCLQRGHQCVYPDRAAKAPPTTASPAQAMSACLGPFMPDLQGTPNGMQLDADFWDTSCLASTNWLDIDLDGFDTGMPDPNVESNVDPRPQPLYSQGFGTSGVYDGASPALTATTGARSDDPERSSQAGEYYVDGEPARLPRTKRRKLSTGTPAIRTQGGAFSLREPACILRSGEIKPISLEVYSQMSRAYQRYCLLDESLWPKFEAADFPSKTFFEHALWLYWENFDQTFPFLHDTLFTSGSDFSWSLAAAMTAIGSHYMGSSHATDFSTSMHEFVRRILRSLDESSEDDYIALGTGHAQVLLLHAVGSAFCGDQRITRHARSAHQALAASYDNVLQHYRESLHNDGDQHSSESAEAYATWRLQQSLIRLGHCIWLFDTMSAYHFQRQASISMASMLPLPCHEKVWRAVDLGEWAVLVREHGHGLPTIAQALQQLYIDKRMPRDRGEFARILIIHGLYRRSWAVERYFSDPLSNWEPNPHRESSADVLAGGEIFLPSVSTFAKWQNTSCDSLDILHWQANATIGQASGLEHPTVMHLHTARIVLLVPYNVIVRFAELATTENAINASLLTRNGHRDIMSSPEAVTIRSWAVRHQYKARLAVIHAGTVFWHARRYSIDAFYEVPAVALAALTLWAFGTFATPQYSTKSAQSSNLVPQPSSMHAVSNGISPPVQAQNVVTDKDADDTCDIILLDRPTDDELVQHFIKDGHRMQAHLGGVGNLYSHDGPRLVLRQGCKLLASSGKTWGVAFEWQALLEKLSNCT